MALAVPLFGVVLVLATYRLGSRFEPRVGIAAVILLTASPVFLDQLVHPAADVPAAALWVLAVACATGTKPRDVTMAGLATSGAVLIRRDLAPLAVAVGLFLVLRPERSWRQRGRAAALYTAWSLPGGVAAALMQPPVQGSPLTAGSGVLDILIAALPAIALAALAPVLLPGSLTLLLTALIAIGLVVVRALLPAMPLVLVLVAAVVDALIVRVAGRGMSPAAPRLRTAYGIAATVAALALAVLFMQQARAHGVIRP